MLKDGRLTRSLITPYQLTIDEKDSKMIFKSRQEKSVLKIKVDSEPVHYPSNVKGGRGFFNLHYPDGRVLLLQ